MEVKINREIREYSEAVFFGLTLRQCVCSGLACAVAIGTWFVGKMVFGQETVSWLCILAAAPFAAAGFVKYNGMKLEEFLLVWIRDRIMTPAILPFEAENLYAELLDMPEEQKKTQEKREKGEKTK